MKKLLNIAGLLALALIIGFAGTACKGWGGNTPSKVTRQFFDAAAKGDLEGMKKASLPENFSKYDEKQLAPMVGKMQWMYANKGGIVSTEETIDEAGDKAAVIVTWKDGSTDKVNVKKHEGEWKIDSVKK